jgi:hypothetical protein
VGEETMNDHPKPLEDPVELHEYRKHCTLNLHPSNLCDRCHASDYYYKIFNPGEFARAQWYCRASPTLEEFNHTWNPRYLQYCRYNGDKSPEEMLKYDNDRHVYMSEFAFWIQAKWREFDLIHPEFKCETGHTDDGHILFDQWLAEGQV